MNRRTLWPFAASHRVVQHDERIADADLRVHDLPVGTDGARDFLRAQRLLVPVDRLRGVVERELRRHGVMSFGNCVSRFGHVASFASKA